MDPSVCLSDEVCLHIFSFLSAQDLANNALVCHRWRLLSLDPLLWKWLCKKDFYMRGDIQEVDWTTLYKRRKKQLDQFNKMSLIVDDCLTQVIQLTDDGRGLQHTSTSPIGEFYSAQASMPLKALPFGEDSRVAYFEVHVEDAGKTGQVMIGIGHNHFALGMAPAGWKKGSYGYHADDGEVFAESVIGRKWGPMYGSGDVVGCGVDFKSRSLFFTKNGKLLGTALRKLKRFHNLYPVVGFRSLGARLYVSFGGNTKFVFAVGSYIQQMEAESILMNEMQGSTRKKKVGNSSESWGGDESEDDDENEEEEDYSDEGEEDDPSLTDMETMNMDPFADILEKISQRDADKDENLVEYCRNQVKSLEFFCLTEGIDFDTLPVDELFEMVREIAIYIRASSASKSIWDLVPQVRRPELNELHYHLIKAELQLLRDWQTYPTSSPVIQLSLAANAAFAQSSPFICTARWQAFTDHEKRKSLILLLGATAMGYEVCVCRRDLAILESKKIPDNHEQKLRALRFVMQEIAPMVAPSAQEVSEDKNYAIEIIKEFETHLLESHALFMKKARLLAGSKSITDRLEDWLALVAQGESTVARPWIRMNILSCLASAGYLFGTMTGLTQNWVGYY